MEDAQISRRRRITRAQNLRITTIVPLLLHSKSKEIGQIFKCLLELKVSFGYSRR
jgi:hypothetical protein